MKKKLGWVLGLSAIGLADSVWMLVLHLSTDLSQTCGLTSSINCSVLHVQTYSEWLGVPVPVFSLLFYAWVALVAWIGLGKEKEQVARPVIYLHLLSWVSIAATLYMATISAFILRTLCPFCFVLYIVSFLFLFVSRSALKELNQSWGHLVLYDIKRAHKSPWLWGVFSVGILTLGLGPYVFKKSTISPSVNQIAPVEARTLGDPHAKVTLTTFSDFQCPHCKIAGEIFQELEHQMRGEVRIVYKFFPLDSSCNSSGGSHPLACKAAVAAYCASQGKKFWLYHDLIYANQETLQDSNFYQFAKAIGLNLGEFDRCLNDPQSLEEIRKDVAEGIGLGIQSTPTIYINGQKYSGPVTVSGLKATVSGSF